MRIFVFSYNRGRYLRNCLESVARHAPSSNTMVIDDDSADPEVRNALAAYPDVEVVKSLKSTDDAYLGGLYNNMQRALGLAENDEPVVFLQDDMQLVRDLDEGDVAHWNRYFSTYPDTFQLYGCFFKRKQVQPGREPVRIERNVPVYFRQAGSGRRSHFSAVGVFHPGRMSRMGWVFEPSEGENNRKVQESGLHMGITPYPFMMWLPNAESAKFRSRSLLHRFAEWYHDVGFYPYQPLALDRTNWLRTRDVEVLPVAEDLLEPIGMNADREWLFADATKAIKPIHRYLKRKKKKQVAREKDVRHRT